MGNKISNPRVAVQCLTRVELENSASANFYCPNTPNVSSIQRAKFRHSFGLCSSTAGLIAYLVYGEVST